MIVARLRLCFQSANHIEIWHISSHVHSGWRFPAGLLYTLYCDLWALLGFPASEAAFANNIKQANKIFMILQQPLKSLNQICISCCFPPKDILIYLRTRPVHVNLGRIIHTNINIINLQVVFTLVVFRLFIPARRLSTMDLVLSL